MKWIFNPFTGNFDAINDLYKGALSSAPSNPQNGWMYYNTSDATLYVFDGVWQAIGSGTPTTNCVLLESGEKLLLEDGSTLGLEA